MIREFENRLATYIGSQLTGDFEDRVFVAGAEPQDALVKISLGAIHHEPWFPEFGSSKAEQIPGQQDFKRVLRLCVEVAFRVAAAQGQGRAQRRLAMDALLYLLEDKEIAEGSAFETDQDQGFLIDEFKPSSSALPLLETVEAPAEIYCKAKGWFWPAGMAGQAGIAIQQTHIRSETLRLELLTQNPLLLAGGDPVELQLKLNHTGFLLQADQSPQQLGLDFLALRLRAANGGPGLGSVAGSAQGANGLAITAVNASGIASFTYTPPANPGKELLLVNLTTGGLSEAEKTAGLPLASLSLKVNAP